MRLSPTYPNFLKIATPPGVRPAIEIASNLGKVMFEGELLKVDICSAAISLLVKRINNHFIIIWPSRDLYRSVYIFLVTDSDLSISISSPRPNGAVRFYGY